MQASVTGAVQACGRGEPAVDGAVGPPAEQSQGHAQSTCTGRWVSGSGWTGSENKNRFFRALKPNEIRDLESVQRYNKKILRDILKFINFIYHEYKVKM